MNDKIPCPKCDGTGLLAGFVNGGRDLSKHYYGTTRCSHCHGNGLVPAAMVQWIEQGKALARRRYQAGYTLMTGSELLGMSTAELSGIENGRAPAPEDADNWWLENKEAV